MMMKFFAVAAATLAVVAASGAMAQRPPTCPCVDWKPWTSDRNTPIDRVYVASTDAWVMEFGPQECDARGDIVPCFVTSEQGIVGFGHHDYLAGQIDSDYCRLYDEATQMVIKANHFLLPFKGPESKTWKWVLTQTGAALPGNAIQDGKGHVLARSTVNAPGQCAGRGFTGWARVLPGDILGDVHFSIVDTIVTTQSFEVAVCEAVKPTTIAPPPTTVPPPLSSKPFIRFAHAVPHSGKVTATITQGATAHSWSCYEFGQFSDWVQVFQVGEGQVSITDCSSGAVLAQTQQLLTPGPLVVAIKGYWPLTNYSIEGIAASYVPTPPGKSGVRLFNLMPDARNAGMRVDNAVAVNGISFTLGSIWYQLDANKEYTYTAFDSAAPSVALAIDKLSAPASPSVFTNWLIGMRNASKGNIFAPRVLPLIDAPEL